MSVSDKRTVLFPQRKCRHGGAVELAHYSEAPDVIVCPCLFAPLGSYSGRLHEWLWTQPTFADASLGWSLSAALAPAVDLDVSRTI